LTIEGSENVNILLAIDNSPHSQVAVEVVLNRTWPAGSIFKAFCAVERREPVFAVMKREEAEAFHKKALDAAKKVTDDVACRLTDRFPDCSATSEAVFGDSKEMILDRINAPTDLIVVGSHGRHGLPRLFLGSVSQTILLYAQCSTLIARYQQAHDGIPEFDKNILVAVDNTPHSGVALDWVMNLPWPDDAQFTLLSVLPPLVDQHTDGIDALFRQFSAERRQARQEAEKFLSENAARLKEKLGSDRVMTDLSEGDAAEKILLAARNWPAGLVVMGSRSHGHLTRWFIGSVSQEVVLQAPCPVEVVKKSVSN
jgi:nucleotide-binding universal stress UspA family protein